MNRLNPLGFALTVVSLLTGASQANARPAAVPVIPQSPGSVESDGSITQHVARLSSAIPAERLEAAQRLAARGIAAHPALENVVRHGNPQAAELAFEILKQAYGSDDKAIAYSAADMLHRIAQSESPQSKRAAEILSAPTAPATGPPRPRIRLGQRERVPGQDRRAGQRISISVRSVNGVREITVDQNGQTFQFKDVTDGIEVTRPDPDGGFETKVYRDEDELQTSDAEAYEVYQRAGANGSGMRIQIGGGFGGGFADPFGDMPFPRLGPMWEPFDSDFFGRRRQRQRQAIRPRPDAPDAENEGQPKLRLLPFDPRVPDQRPKQAAPPPDRIEV